MYDGCCFFQTSLISFTINLLHLKHKVMNIILALKVIGQRTIKIFYNIILFQNFLFASIKGIFTLPYYFNITIQAIINIGFYSLPIVAATSLCSGAVLALQTYEGVVRSSAIHAIPMIIVTSITRELGPVIVGLIVAGRIGASIVAEIGTMRVTEQIDALFTLATDPIKYLVTPRLVATTLSLPFLVLASDVIGVFGGYLVSVYRLNFNSYEYIQSTIHHLTSTDVISGLIKAIVFGIIIGITSCFHGYYSDKGAKGVGIATTYGVVHSSILILLSNYIMTELLLSQYI
ncbi:putative permease [Orientia tsutsugamushi str. Kato PP]|uniref:ABC transporter permease n=2 Tax=Orientia tsutsugamushi TaxID=784 RepID=A0A2U3QU97_ORITS|nr:putative permease [Orientia tsutsugamushi str. Kato PP]SPR04555.1 ABC transporter permease [Orientia tsutsugamushi]